MTAERDALAELVACKDIMERNELVGIDRRAAAWAAARAALAAPAQGKPKCTRCDDTGCPVCDPEWAQHQAPSTAQGEPMTTPPVTQPAEPRAPVAYLYEDDARSLKEDGEATVYAMRQKFVRLPEPNCTPLYAAPNPDIRLCVHGVPVERPCVECVARTAAPTVAQPAEPHATDDLDRLIERLVLFRHPDQAKARKHAIITLQRQARDLTALRAENERLTGLYDAMCADYNDAGRDVNRERKRAERADAECEKLREDAERYRWLRANWTTMNSIATRSDLRLEVGIAPWADFSGETIDAAIDAARAGK